MLSAADRFGYSCRRSGTRVRPRRAAHITSPAGAGAPKIVTSPRRRARPTIPISKLLLPLPLGPTIATASPRPMLKVASRTATRSP